MRIDQAKALHMRDVLSAMGYEPVKEAKGECWYCSPLRKETKESFSISADGKAWFDLGAGKGGNILDLVMAHQRTDIRGALRFLDSLNTRYPASTKAPAESAMQEKLWDSPETLSETRIEASEYVSRDKPPEEQEDTFSITSVKPLQNRALIQYLQRRAIGAETARDWVKEIYYRCNGTAYFALAFENNSGAYEARNPYFKGIMGGSKDITTIGAGEGDKTAVAVFEGFMDFLSAITISGHLPTMPVIVLNSTAMQEKALQAIRQMGVETVYLYLDRDASGQKLATYFIEYLPNVTVIDKSSLYEGYKDLNDWLIFRSQATARAI